jgi:protocatechuate 3,4-dioxygenase beta subunit
LAARGLTPVTFRIPEAIMAGLKGMMSRTVSSSLPRRDWLRAIMAYLFLLSVPRWARGSDAAAGRVRLSPELTEGPYYIDLERIRRNIREGKPGVPLLLRVRVVDGATGQPVPNAAVDIWHCDAQGIYSGFSGHGPGPGGGPPPGGALFFKMTPDGPFPPPPPGATGAPFPPGGGHGFGHKPDNKQTFLRGVQLTGPDGIAEIETIFPGWYQGRTTHIHARVHLGGSVAGGRYRGGHITHTGQIFFPEALTSRVYQLAAYRKMAAGRVPLNQDGIFLQGGSEIATVTPRNPAQLESGLVSESELVINPQSSQGGHPRPI